MPYKFNFDFSSVPKKIFEDIARISYEKGLHKKAKEQVLSLIKKFRLEEVCGLDLASILEVMEDLVEIYCLNKFYDKEFKATSKRALLLPHCSRKYMDYKCKASFDSSISSYFCNSCSPDCLVNIANNIGKEKGYDVYILPGSSCIPKIIEKYEGVVGVACGNELKLAGEFLKIRKIPGQAVPLIKNGCSQTKFSLEMLENIL